MNRNVICLLALIALAALVGSSATASTVNVDFGSTSGPSGTYSGTAAAPDAGTTWNGLAPAANVTPFATYTSGALVDSNGNPTGVTTTVNNAWDYDGAADSLIAPALTHDYIFSTSAGSDANFTFSIDGLTPGGMYDLYLYSDTGLQITTFTIDGVSKTVTNTAEQSAWNPGSNYEVYSGLTAAGGTIAVTVSGNEMVGNVGPFYGVLNGFQLQEVPEPSTFVLLAAGLAGLLACVRRKM